MNERAKNAILGSLVADAAAVGLHWVYDVDEVKRRAGDTPEFHSPAESQYHARRTTGQLSHYGDHLVVVLESLAAKGGLDAGDYRSRYITRFGADDYDGYLDHATKDLVENGAGSDDNQAGCFTKLPALAARYADDPEFDARVEEAIRITHDNTQAVRYGLAAAAAIRAAIQGADPSGAVQAAAELQGAPAALARKAYESQEDHVAFAVATGQTCPVPNAFPVALHATLCCTDFRDVVRRSILAGGDSNGRLFVTAAIRGATDGVPAEWLEKLVDRAHFEALIDRIGLP